MKYLTKANVVTMVLVFIIFTISAYFGKQLKKTDVEVINDIVEESLNQFSVESDPSGIDVITDMETGCQYIRTRYDSNKVTSMVPRTYGPHSYQVCDVLPLDHDDSRQLAEGE